MTFRTLSRCECGGLIRAQEHDTCLRCRLRQAAQTPKAVTPQPVAVPRHVPSSIYVQHDLIAARWRWSVVR